MNMFLLKIIMGLLLLTTAKGFAVPPEQELATSSRSQISCFGTGGTGRCGFTGCFRYGTGCGPGYYCKCGPCGCGRHGCGCCATCEAGDAELATSSRSQIGIEYVR